MLQIESYATIFFSLKLPCSLVYKRIQYDKQTFEATHVIIRTLQEKSMSEMMASVNIFQLPKAFRFKNQNTIVVRAVCGSLKIYCC